VNRLSDLAKSVPKMDLNASVLGVLAGFLDSEFGAFNIPIAAVHLTYRSKYSVVRKL
jgi:hypothetical protein